MTLERFAMLADAYGGTVMRWPVPDRDAALAIARTPAAAAILARAQDVDDVLDAWRIPAPSDHLLQTIPLGASSRGRGRLWWPGLGIAAALAGATAGASAVAVLTTVDIATDAATSFGDVAAQEG